MPPCLLGVGALPQVVEQLAEQIGDGGEHQIGLGRKVPEEGPLGHIDGGTDVLDRDRVIAALGEEIGGGVDERGTGLRLLALPEPRMRCGRGHGYLTS